MSKLNTFRAFVNPSQRSAMYSAMQGEEGAFFRELVGNLITALDTMPEVYEQDGLGDQAIVYLHYFTGSQDWYITERDTSEEQHQAFGLADFGDGGELGYISIAELIKHGVELDLYWKPRTLAEIRIQKAA